MRLVFLFVLFALFFHVQSFTCLGSVPSYYSGRDFNCFALCCAEGYVMDLNTTGVVGCVSCESVGLVGCRLCSLIPFDRAENISYKCLASKNIPNLLTVGISSTCADPSGQDERFYALSNYSNFNQCVPCSSMMPFAERCQISYTCQTKIRGKTGNKCVAYV